MNRFLMKLLMVTLVSLQSYAAISPQSVQKTNSAFLAQNSTFAGGIAGVGFSLLDLRRSVDLNRHQERLVFDIGDLSGGIHRGVPGYYQAQYRGNKLIFDFSQMPKSRVNEQVLTRIFKNSKVVSRAELTADPVDSSLMVSLELAAQTKIKIYQVKGQQKATSKVVVDLYY